jgi:hypothetical protein
VFCLGFRVEYHHRSLQFIVPCSSLFPTVRRSLPFVITLSCVMPLLLFPSPVISTSISPYKQWLAGRVVVLCDVALISVQERDPLPPCKQRLAAAV